MSTISVLRNSPYYTDNGISACRFSYVSFFPLLETSETIRNLPKDTQIARAGAMLDTRIFDSKSSVPSTKLLLHKNISLGPPEDYFIKG